MTSDKLSFDRVPSDFPRKFGGSVSGVQNKLIVRMIDGRFVEGMTEDELWVRYEACQHLATKLTEHASRKRSEYAELSLGDFLRRLRAGAVKKGWDLTSEELDWVMGRVAVTLGGSLQDALYRITVDANWIGALSTSTNPPVESLIDRVRAKLEQ
ncbi:UNVERIFIED_ORG: hypothetical protein LHJ69_05460 [Shinella sp. XGS7]|nr:hypothetical protein [Shinella sp. XGS7]